jgi:hypothetical protein
MKPIRLATIGIIAAGAMCGAVAASAAPLPAVGTLAGSATSQVVPVGCWYDYYGRYHCRQQYGHRRYYHHRNYYRY